VHLVAIIAAHRTICPSIALLVWRCLGGSVLAALLIAALVVVGASGRALALQT